MNPIDNPAVRFVPTSFDPNDALTGFPIPSAWRWQSAADTLARMRPHGVMMRLPLFWQMEVPLWHACRFARTPLFLNDIGNMPVGAAALARGGIDTVVTEASDAQLFAAYLHERKHTLPRNWLIVHRASDEWQIDMPATTAVIAEEVHIIPGVPVFYKCEHLTSIRTTQYHALDAYQYDLDKHELRLPPQDDVSARTLKLPSGIQTDSTCVCGKQLYKKYESAY